MNIDDDLLIIGLPTASPTDIKLIIILIYSVGDLLKIRR